MNQMRHVIVGVSLAAGLAFNSAWALDISAQTNRLEAGSERGFCEKVLHGKLFSRTELFFGLSRSGGLPDVTEAQFQTFLDTEVTPRFPDGLTLLTGTGQFKNSGIIIQERSKLLILLYPFNQKSYGAVEEIRQAYKDAFQQEGVLRVDEQSCISF